MEQDPETFPIYSTLVHLQTQTADEFFRYTYFGGICNELRAQAWPYLFGFVDWQDELTTVVDASRVNYEEAMSEWLVVESIVRQRDKEQFDAGLLLFILTNLNCCFSSTQTRWQCVIE